MKRDVQLESGRLALYDGLSRNIALGTSIRTWYNMRGRFPCNVSPTRLVCRIVIVGDQPDAWYGRWSTSNRTRYHDSLHDTIFNELTEPALEKAAICLCRVQEPLKTGC